jgi:hypothetical protein
MRKTSPDEDGANGVDADDLRSHAFAEVSQTGGVGYATRQVRSRNERVCVTFAHRPTICWCRRFCSLCSDSRPSASSTACGRSWPSCATRRPRACRLAPSSAQCTTWPTCFRSCTCSSTSSSSAPIASSYRPSCCLVSASRLCWHSSGKRAYVCVCCCCCVYAHCHVCD